MQLYLIAGIVGLLLIASAGMGGYQHGRKTATNEAKAAQLEAVNKAIAQARQTAIEDMQLEIEAEQKRQKTRIEYRDRIVTVKEYLNAKPIPAECRIPDNALSVFRDAINAANGAQKSPESKPVPAPNPTLRRASNDDSERLP